MVKNLRKSFVKIEKKVLKILSVFEFFSLDIVVGYEPINEAGTSSSFEMYEKLESATLELMKLNETITHISEVLEKKRSNRKSKMKSEDNQTNISTVTRISLSLEKLQLIFKRMIVEDVFFEFNQLNTLKQLARLRVTTTKHLFILKGIEYEERTNFQVATLGSISTGKSSLLQRYVSKSFSPSIPPTIALHPFVHYFSLDPESRDYRILLWDTPGSIEMFNSFSRQDKRKWIDADGVIFVYSIDSRTSFEETNAYWMNEFKNTILPKKGTTTHSLILGNKTDLVYSRNYSKHLINRWRRKTSKQQFFSIYGIYLDEQRKFSKNFHDCLKNFRLLKGVIHQILKKKKASDEHLYLKEIKNEMDRIENDMIQKKFVRDSESFKSLSVGRMVSFGEGSDLAVLKNSFFGETSAKCGCKVSELFDALICEIIAENSIIAFSEESRIEKENVLILDYAEDIVEEVLLIKKKKKSICCKI